MIYLIVSRRKDGFMSEKVKLSCTLEEAKSVGKLMLHSNCIKYEIYEEGKEYMGDFRIKPVFIGE